MSLTFSSPSELVQWETGFSAARGRAAGSGWGEEGPAERQWSAVVGEGDLHGGGGGGGY